jgi:hypothetical protein
MRTQRRSAIVVLGLSALLLAGTGQAHADVLFNNGQVNVVNTTINDLVQVFNNTTVIFNTGGNVFSPPLSPLNPVAVSVLDTSQVINNGGMIVGVGNNISDIGLAASGNAVVNVFGGSIVSGTGLRASGSAVVNVFGGSIRGGNPLGPAIGLTASDNAVVDIFGGTLVGQGFIGGTSLSASGNAVVNVFGGSIGQGVFGGNEIDVTGAAQVTFYGSGFNLPFGPVLPRSGTLTGTLQNGNSIAINFNQFQNGQIFLAPPAVPEPSSLALFALGSLALAGWRRWRKRTPGSEAP